MSKISEFLSENFHFLVVKFSDYLNRLVFVMQFLLMPVCFSNFELLQATAWENVSFL